MMVINRPTVRDCESGIRVESVISTNGKSSTAYFEVDEEYRDYLCDDRADSFLVAFLFYALTLGTDIHVKAPVSQALLYQIESSLIDFLVAIYPERKFRRIRISSDSLAEPCVTQGAVGTGVSCGIDSLTTIFRHHQHEMPGMRLTHLCFFDTGSHGRLDDMRSLQLFEFRKRLATDFSHEIGLPLVEVRSNLSELIPLPFAITHTYLNCAAVLALQRLFSTYYYSSGSTALGFLKTNVDPAYYDIYLLPLLSSRSVRFYSSEENLGRYQKTKVVVSNRLSHKYLNVCNATGENCGNCNKCIRALITLDALGVIDNFGSVFDLNAYRKKRNSYLSYHVKHFLNENAVHLDLHPHIRNQLTIHNIFFGRLRHYVGMLRKIFKNANSGI